jgi:Recombination endonuclease VII
MASRGKESLTSSERAKDKRLQRIYKMTLDQQKELREEQNNTCAGCGRDFNKYTPFQDHLHKCCPRKLKEFCGKCNRGLLCYLCNKFVVGTLERGQPLPPLELLARITAYFQKWEPILKARGAYEVKEKSTVRKKKKSV